MIINVLFTIALLLTIVFPVLGYFVSKKKGETRKRFKRSLAISCVSFFGVFAIASVYIFTSPVSAAIAPTASASSGLGLIAAAVAIGAACLASGYAVAASASAALGALSENEGIFGKALIFVALGEGIALWGFIVAFLILNHIA